MKKNVIIIDGDYMIPCDCWRLLWSGEVGRSGADVNANGYKGRTVLHNAARTGNQDMVKWFKAHGAKE